MTFAEMFRKKLEQRYVLRPIDLKEDAVLKKSGMTFRLSCYDAEGLGHFFCMDMSGMLGLMKMETVILAVETKKVPLINIDYIKAMGKETMMAEYYDTAKDNIPEGIEKEFFSILNEDKVLEDYPSGDHWYNDILLPFTYRKKGKKMTEHFLKVGEREVDTFLRFIDKAENASKEERQRYTLNFARSLLDNGGPAVDQFTRLFGKEKAEKVVREYMYGIR